MMSSYQSIENHLNQNRSNNLLSDVNFESRQLEPNLFEIETICRTTFEYIKKFYSSIDQIESLNTSEITQFAKNLIETLPNQPQSLEYLLKFIFSEVVPRSQNTQASGFLAYIPGGGLFYSAIGDLITSIINRHVGYFVHAPALIQIESNVIRWFCEIVKYPTTAKGILSSGGSMANFSAIVTARKQMLPDDFLTGTLYVSEQAHNSIKKGAFLAGFAPRNIRVVPTDDQLRMNHLELKKMITEDREKGWMPFLVVGSGGTTNTGAVDDLTAIAEIARQEKLWFHVDAAYGGFFMLTERGQRELKGIELSDSVTLDPHKGLFIPYGTGALLVKNSEALRSAHRTSAAYLPDPNEDPDCWDFSQISPELTRNSRGIRIWIPLQIYGVDVFRQYLNEKLDLAQWVAHQLAQIKPIQVFAQPQLSVLGFSLDISDLSVETLNDLNQDLLERINQKKRVFLSGTILRGRFILRISILSFRTHLAVLEQCLEDIQLSKDEVIAKWNLG